MVAFPVQLMAAAPGPKYSIIAFVAPETVSFDATKSITSFGEAQLFSSPLRYTPMRFGYNNSQDIPAITSAASRPPTPIASIPRPPAFGVWESVPIINPPGKA